MRRALIAYAVTLVVFLVLDFIWLSTMMPRLYQPLMASLLAEQPRLGAVALFYPLYVVGVVVFAVWPALPGDGGPARIRWRRALGSGALLGLVAYGTYDMTNLATLRDWSVLITVVDIAWGTCVTAATAMLGALATARLSPARAP